VPRDLDRRLPEVPREGAGPPLSTAQALAENWRFLHDEPILARPVSLPERLCVVPAQAGAGALIILVHLVGAVGLGCILWQWRRPSTNASGPTERLCGHVRSANEAVEANNFIRASALLERAVASRSSAEPRWE